MKIGRNDPCPCGSGKKFKKCCIDKPEFRFGTNKESFNTKSGGLGAIRHYAVSQGSGRGSVPMALIPDRGDEKKALAIAQTLRQQLLSREATFWEDGPGFSQQFKFTMNPKGPLGFRYRRRLEQHKSPLLKQIEAMEFSKILQRLSSLGIPMDEERLANEMAKAQQNGVPSYTLVAKGWMDATNSAFQREDEDFVYYSAEVLWKRLASDAFCVEHLDDLMQQGYELLGDDTNSRQKPATDENWKRAIDVWWKLWRTTMTYVGDKPISSLEELDKRLEQILLQCYFNWSGDFELELTNAARRDAQYADILMTFVRELCERFPKTAASVRLNLQRAVADTLFFYGRRDEGDAWYEEIVQQFPEEAWGYIGWAMHYHPQYDGAGHEDIAKVVQLYHQGRRRAKVETESLEMLKEGLEASLFGDA